MELFGREFYLEQAIWLAEVYATPDEDLVHRINKLKKRYPNGFSAERSINR